jgi:photosystem II stability/assembly factor-like uncharacterized protein
MKRLFLTLLAVCQFGLFFLLEHCVGGSDTGNPTAGGTDTGNPTLAKVLGKVVDSTGAPRSDVHMELLPASFNPVENTTYPDTVSDMTDMSGQFLIQAMLDTGRYVLNGFHALTGDRLIRKDVGIYDSIPFDLGTDTLRPTRVVSVTIADSAFEPGGYLYMPGTRIYMPVDSPSTIAVDAVIPDLLELVYSTPSNQSTITPVYSGPPAWSPLGGPYGGRVNAILAMPGGEVFAATEYSGVFRSQNQGQDWTQAAWPTVTAPSAYSKTVNALAVDSAGQVLAGTTHNGILASADNGLTWTLTGMDYGYFPSLAVIPNGHIFAGDGVGGLQRSQDGGAVWEQVLGITYGSNNALQALAANAQGIIFLGFRNSGVYVTKESGTGMATNVSIGIGNQPVQTVAVSNGGTVFLGTAQGGVYRSADAGSSWVQINIGLTNQNVLSLAVLGTDRLFAGTNGSGIFESQDAGATWSPITNSAVSTLAVYSLCISGSGELYAGSGNGAYYSPDMGTTWTDITRGITAFDMMAIAADEPYLFTGTMDRGVFRSSDNGQTWTNVYPTGDFTYLFINSAGHVFSGPLKSTDRGDNWTMGSGLSGFICAMAENRTGTLFASNDRGNVFRSLDGGDTWSVTGTFASNFIETIALNSQDHVYAGTWSGEGIYRSLDNGNSWENIADTLGSIWRLAFNSRDHLFVVHGNSALWRSLDNGATWQEVYQAPAGKNIHALLIDKLDNIFISTDEGVFFSPDNGAAWQAAGTGLNGQWVKCMALTRDNRLVAGTEGGGAFMGFR